MHTATLTLRRPHPTPNKLTLHRSPHCAQRRSTPSSAFGLATPKGVGVDSPERATWSDAMSSGGYDAVVRALGALVTSALAHRAWLASLIAELFPWPELPDHYWAEVDATPWRYAA